MIENKEIGLKIAENSDETFWTERKEETLKAIEIEKRNIKIHEHMVKLCEQELSGKA